MNQEMACWLMAPSHNSGSYHKEEFENYRQVSNIRRTKSQHLKDLHAVFAESLEARS